MFAASYYDRHEYASAREMADANRDYWEKQARANGGWDVPLQLLEAAQTIVHKLNEALGASRSGLLHKNFESRAQIVLGRNGRSVSTFSFADGSRVISIDLDLFYEICVLMYGISREESYGAWLAAFMFYHNIQSTNASFPEIEMIFDKCLDRSPRIFEDIMRSCLYCLILHELGHEYSAQCGTGHAALTAEIPHDAAKYRTLCINPPHGPKYTIFLGGDGKERVYVPEASWMEEFAADQFAMQSTMEMVSAGAVTFSSFEKTIHHVALWQFVIFYLGAGNLFRHDQNRGTHPTAHNRVDLMVFHLDPVGVALFGDWRSSALSIFQQRYTHLFSPLFAGLHRMLCERVQAIQPVAYISGDGVLSNLTDKPDPFPLLRALLHAELLARPFEAWSEPLEELAGGMKYGYDHVISDMASFLREMNFRFENDD